MSQEATAALTPETHEGVGGLLRQLVELRFVLTDRDGAVTRWSRPAHALFGWEAAAMLGQPLLETLGATGSPPASGGRLTSELTRADGSTIEAELAFVPVRMSQSLEFNGFLSALEDGDAGSLSVERLRRGHTGVVDWIEASIAGRGELEDGELTAGTIVTFRPTAEVELFDTAESLEPEQAEEAGDAGAVDRAGIADVIGRMSAAIDRSDDLERALAGTREALEEARAGADSARGEAEAARAEAGAAAARVAELEERNGRLGEELREASRSTGETRSLLETLRGEVRDRTGEAAAESRSLVGGLEAELERTRSAVEELRAEVAELRSREPVDAEPREDVRRVGEDARRASEAASAAAGHAERAAGRAEAAAGEAGGHAELVQQVMERLGGRAERRRAGPEADGATDGRDDVLRPEPAGHGADAPAEREPRPGFDDAERPMATIGTDGRFRELNPGFRELVGHSEEEFRAATWPPVMDRANLPKHRDQMRAMLEGEMDSVEVSTGYLHAQGLLVPVAGTLSLVRDDRGEPDHFLLEARGS